MDRSKDTTKCVRGGGDVLRTSGRCGSGIWPKFKQTKLNIKWNKSDTRVKYHMISLLWVRQQSTRKEQNKVRIERNKEIDLLEMGRNLKMMWGRGQKEKWNHLGCVTFTRQTPTMSVNVIYHKHAVKIIMILKITRMKMRKEFCWRGRKVCVCETGKRIKLCYTRTLTP